MLVIVSMQHALGERNSLAFRKRKSEFVGDWGNEKGIQSVYIQYDSDLLKCKCSLRPLPCSIDAASIQILSNTTLALIVVCDLSLIHI